MSTPTNSYRYPDADPLLMAQSELGDVSSCLHMPREPILGPHDDACGPDGYLVNNEKWAKHAHDHLHAAREWLRIVDRQRAALNAKVYKLERRRSYDLASYEVTTQALRSNGLTLTLDFHNMNHLDRMGVAYALIDFEERYS